MSSATVQQMADRVAELMEERLRIRGDGLDEKLRRGGRALPKRVRREAEFLAQAARVAQVPKLLVQIDNAKVTEAYDACLRYLRPLGKGARLRGFLLDLAASWGFAILATVALVVVVLIWRGFL